METPESSQPDLPAEPKPTGDQDNEASGSGDKSNSGSEKSMKRKLFPSSDSNASEGSNNVDSVEGKDKEKKPVLIKRKKADSESAEATPVVESCGSPTPSSSSVTGQPPTTPRTPKPRLIMSERQQMALILQMTTSESSDEASSAVGSPLTPVSSTKKTPNSDRSSSKFNKKNEKGETPLHIAAKKGDLRQTKKLIKGGANVNEQDYAGWTPLHEACNHGCYRVAKALIRHGADVNACGMEKFTPLHDAAINNHIKVVELLLRNGADPNAMNDPGKTPTDLAASPEVDRLLRTKFEINRDLPSTSIDVSSDESDDCSDIDESGEQKTSIADDLGMSELKSDNEDDNDCDKVTSSPRLTMRFHLERSDQGLRNEQGQVYSVQLTDRKKPTPDSSDGKVEYGGRREDMPDSQSQLDEIKQEPSACEEITSTSDAIVEAESQQQPVSTSQEEEPVSRRQEDEQPQPSSNTVLEDEAVVSQSERDVTTSKQEEPACPEAVPSSSSSGSNQEVSSSSLPVEEPGRGNAGEAEAVPVAENDEKTSPYDFQSDDEGKVASSSRDKEDGLLSSSTGSTWLKEVRRRPLGPGEADDAANRPREVRKRPKGTLRKPADSSGNTSNGDDGAPKVPKLRIIIPGVKDKVAADTGTLKSLLTKPQLPYVKSSSGEETSESSKKNDGDETDRRGRLPSRDSDSKKEPEKSQRTLRSHTAAKREKEVPSSHDAATDESAIPPRKRKLRGRQLPPVEAQSPAPPPLPIPSAPREKPVNSYEQFIEIRRQINKKWDQLHQVEPKMPSNFKEFKLYNRNYTLSTKKASYPTIPESKPASSLPEKLRDLYRKQERERSELKLQHHIQKERLQISREHEVLRCHYRAAREMVNQPVPFSFCTIVKDEEIYNTMQLNQEAKERSVRDRFSSRQLTQWIQDVEDKFDKLKASLSSRQRHEADSLFAVQKMDWQGVMREAGLWDGKGTARVELHHVLMVEVVDVDFRK